MHFTFISISKFYFLAVIFMMIIGMMACADDSFDDSPFECTELVSFRDDIVPMINTSCANASNCHQVDFDYGDFTNYAGVKDKVAAIEWTVFGIKTMPPNNTTGPKELTGLELNLLECWISNGALDN